ncbi:hypothetical protein NG726_02475 [Pseudomonas sp. MOB-449]|nr:hypothetical protein [Pseudomonas sp. MOB-449]
MSKKNLAEHLVNNSKGLPRTLLPSFPPARDFPIVVSKLGEVISRFGDDSFDYSIYAGRPAVINFYPNKKGINLDEVHYELLRVLTAYLQFEYRRVVSAKTIMSYCQLLKKTMAFCIGAGVRFDQLYRYPRIVNEFAIWLSRLNSRSSSIILMLLVDIYTNRGVIGFYALDKGSLNLVKSFSLSRVDSKQTPYIPERLWYYQINRIDYFLDKFLNHERAFVRLYLKLLRGYLKNLGSIEKACRSGQVHYRSPVHNRKMKGLVRYGSFAQLAERSGVLDVIKELIFVDKDCEVSAYAGAKPLGSYFTAISFIAQAFIINFSGMRISEVSSLRVNCFEKDVNLGGGVVSFFRGVTKKTKDDDEALWVTCELAEKAVKALTVISKLRMRIAEMDSRISVSEKDLENPFLVVKCYETVGLNKKVCRRKRHEHSFVGHVRPLAAILSRSFRS